METANQEKKKVSKLWEWLMSDEPPLIDKSKMSKEDIERFTNGIPATLDWNEVLS